jgi:transcriptional regulator with XRE-family HTH domain
MLVDAVKRSVRAHKMTYGDLAERLDLSERTVKRILNLEQEDFSRLLAIAEAMGISAQQLLDMGSETRDLVFRLSEDEEAQLAANPLAWAFFYELQRGREPSDVALSCNLPEPVVERCLRDLEGMGLLERGAKFQVRLKHQGEQSLRWGGPLQREILINRQGTFAQSVLRHTMNGMVRDAHINMPRQPNLWVNFGSGSPPRL